MNSKLPVPDVYFSLTYDLLVDVSEEQRRGIAHNFIRQATQPGVIGDRSSQLSFMLGEMGNVDEAFPRASSLVQGVLQAAGVDSFELVEVQVASPIVPGAKWQNITHLIIGERPEPI